MAISLHPSLHHEQTGSCKGTWKTSQSTPNPACSAERRTDVVASPLLVLEESLLPEDQNDITPHDLIEAYNVLFYRLKVPKASFSVSQAAILSACLQRDMHESSEYAILLIAIQVFSRVLASSELIGTFSERNLSSMYSALLSLFDVDLGRNIRIAAIFALNIRFPPQSVLQATGQQLVNTLSMMIASRSRTARDGLQAAQNLAHQHPSGAIIVIAPSSLIQTILQQLINDEDLLGPIAATLAAIAHAKILSEDEHDTNSKMNQDLSDQLSGFMSLTLDQGSQSPFFHMTTRFLADENKRDKALQLVASMIVLHDFHLYSQPSCLKYYFRAHEKTFAHFEGTSTQPISYCYRSLVWAYNRYPVQDVETESSALKVVAQEVREGIGTALIYAVLTKDKGDPERALEVVKNMLTRAHGSYVAEGLQALERMLDQNAETLDGSGHHILHRPFFDGSDECRKEGERRATCIMNIVPPLDSAFVETHWETILELWNLCVDKACMPSSSKRQLSVTALNHVLQVLLLSPSELTQGNGHLTTDNTVLDTLAALLCKVMPLKLKLAAEFWGVATRVFGDISLGHIAQQVVKAFFCLSPDVTSSGMGTPLLMSLVSSVDPWLMVNLVRNLKPELGVQRAVWFRLTKSCLSDEKGEHDTAYRIQLLILPLRSWFLDETDLNLWLNLATSTLDKSDWVDSLDQLAIQLGEEAVPHLHANIQIIPTLLSHPKPPLSRLPTRFLTTMSSAVTFLYPPSPRPDTTSLALRIFSALLNVLDNLPPNLVVTLLESTAPCLETWFSDITSCVPADDYNTILMKLYTTILSHLSSHPPSTHLITIISPILSSVFQPTPIPQPGIGPTAFKAFWEQGWRGKERLYYPGVGDALRDCLQVLWGDGRWDTVPGSDDDDDDDDEGDEGIYTLQCTASLRRKRDEIEEFVLSRPRKKRRRGVKAESVSQRRYDATSVGNFSDPFEHAERADEEFSPFKLTDDAVEESSPFKLADANIDTSLSQGKPTPDDDRHNPTLTVSVSISATNVTTPSSTPSQKRKVTRLTRRRRSSQRFAFSAMTAITSPHDTVRMESFPEAEEEQVLRLPGMHQRLFPEAEQDRGLPVPRNEAEEDEEMEYDYDTWEARVSSPEMRRIRDQVSREEEEEEGRRRSMGSVLASPFALPTPGTSSRHDDFSTPPNKKAGPSAGIALIEQGLGVFEELDSSLVLESQDLDKLQGALKTLQQQTKKLKEKKREARMAKRGADPR